jgi:hypothetical protein
MVVGWGIGFAIAMIVVLILLRVFFKTAFKILSIIWLVVFLASVAFAILVYVDIKDMQEKCPELPAALLLEDEGRILAGIRMDVSGEGGEISGEEAFVSSLKRYQTAYDEEDFDKLLEEEHCRIVIFQLSAFEGLDNITIGEGIEISLEKVFAVLRADDPAGELFNGGISVGGANFTAAQLKGVVFAGLFAKALDERGPGFVIEAFNEGKARTAKSRMTFRILRFMPKSLFDEIMEKIPSREGEE